MTTFARLAPDGERAAHEWLADVDPRGRAPADRPFLFLNMVASADGRAALEGRTSPLGSPADTLLLTELRALADAVLLGTNTVRAEGYARLVGNPERIARRVAAGLPETPLAVLITRTLQVPWEAGLFAAPDQPVLVYAPEASDPPAVAAPVEVVPLPDVSPPAVLADLRRRGIRALLCEGGPRLNGALLACDAVDELFLTVAPLLAGNAVAPRIVEGDGLAAPIRLELAWALSHDDELYLRYRIARDG